MSKEVFKDLPGYEELYQVSNLGRVKSLIRRKILSPKKRGDGYLSLTLSKNKKTKDFLVHQLVAITFLNHKPNKGSLVIDHIDRDKSNNDLTNLRETDLRGNMENTDKSNHSSDYVGVCLNKYTGKYVAYFKHNKKRFHVGTFNTQEEAYKARLKALSKI